MKKGINGLYKTKTFYPNVFLYLNRTHSWLIKLSVYPLNARWHCFCSSPIVVVLFFFSTIFLKFIFLTKNIFLFFKKKKKKKIDKEEKNRNAAKVSSLFLFFPFFCVYMLYIHYTLKCRCSSSRAAANV